MKIILNSGTAAMASTNDKGVKAMSGNSGDDFSN